MAMAMAMARAMESKVNFSEYGDPNGKQVVYFHGAPGSPEECSVFDREAKSHRLNIICYDRFSIDASVENEDYYRYIAKLIMDKTNGEKVDVIGFSIGCHTAIETCLYLEDSVRELHLISPAAPLDAANFLDGMAGEVVFSLAMKHPILFALLSYWQAILAKLFPAALMKILFASAIGADKSLSKTLDFQNYIKPILVQCFGKNAKGYIREVNQYVAPWMSSIFKCGASTHLWHGNDDNWSPVSMANYLKINMPASSELEIFEGLSHYSCLYAAAPKICKKLSGA